MWNSSNSQKNLKLEKSFIQNFKKKPENAYETKLGQTRNGKMIRIEDKRWLIWNMV